MSNPFINILYSQWEARESDQPKELQIRDNRLSQYTPSRCRSISTQTGPQERGACGEHGTI